MKKLALVLTILAFAVSAQAVTFQWDASPSTGVTGYRVYQSTTVGMATTTRVCNVNALTCIVADSGFVEGTTYYFTARSVNAGGIESDDSNQVSHTKAYTKPLPPSNLRKIIQQVIEWLQNRFNKG